MPATRTFDQKPRDYALELIDEGVSALTLLTACLQYMSHDDVREMLDMNELSPRFQDVDDDADCDPPAADDDDDKYADLDDVPYGC